MGESLGVYLKMLFHIHKLNPELNWNMTANEKWLSMHILGTGYYSLYVVVRVF